MSGFKGLLYLEFSPSDWELAKNHTAERWEVLPNICPVHASQSKERILFPC